MICSNCDANLPGGTNFCPRCGNKMEDSPERRVRSSAVQECSEKGQLMIWTPSHGLFFFHRDQLFPYDGASDTLEVLTERARATRLCGMGYSEGNLDYWQECRDERSPEYGMKLLELDIGGNQTRVVWESDGDLFYHFRLDDNPLKGRAILYQDYYYLLDYEDQSLMRVSLADGEQENLPLPDMRRRIPLMDWLRPRGMIDIRSGSRNFGVRYTGLDIVEDNVYLSLDGCAVCTLRFPLDEPEKFQYLPMNACTAVQMGGMLTSVNGRIYSCPSFAIGTNELGIYEIQENGDLLRLLSNAAGDLSLVNKGKYWWRLGDTVYIGLAALNLLDRKWHRLPDELYDYEEHRDNPFGQVRDFIPGRAGVYLLTETGLYLVPRDWEQHAEDLEDLEKFRLLGLDELTNPAEQE